MAIAAKTATPISANANKGPGRPTKGKTKSGATAGPMIDPMRPTASPQGGTSGSGGLGGALSNLGDLVAVDRLDPQQQRLLAAIETAREALDGGDLTAAREALAPLAESGDRAVADWLASADRRLAAEQAAAALHDRLQAMLAAAG